MHSYATDTNDDKKATKLSLFASILTFIIITVGSFMIPITLHFMVKLTISSAIGIFANYLSFGFYSYIIENRLWRRHFFRSVFKIKTHDLNGIWVGVFIRKQAIHEEQKNEKVYMVMTIKQTLSKFSLSGHSQKYETNSNVSTIYNEQAKKENRLLVGYENNPLTNIDASKFPHHDAFSQTEILDNQLLGEYFAGRGRGTYGEINMIRVMENKQIESVKMIEKRISSDKITIQDKKWIDSIIDSKTK